MSGSSPVLASNQPTPIEIAQQEHQLVTQLNRLGVAGFLGPAETKDVINKHVVPTIEEWIRKAIRPLSSNDLAPVAVGGWGGRVNGV